MVLHISHIAGGALRVLLSDSDLSRFGTDFAALREGDPQTKAVIRRILRAVFEQEDMPQETALTVEAVPADGGCLLLITPRSRAADSIYTVFLSDENALLQLQQALRTQVSDAIVSTVLYRLPDHHCLTLYCEHVSEHIRTVLHEFGTVHTGVVPAARAAEFAVSEAVYDFC